MAARFTLKIGFMKNLYRYYSTPNFRNLDLMPPELR